jgi:hypothetical protein
MLSKQEQSELNRLAHQIAAISAESAIESHCSQPNPRARWFNIERVSGRAEKADVARAVKYLELRGLLKRHPSNAGLVRCRRG